MKEYLFNTIKELLEVDSPSGFTNNIRKKLKEIILNLGYKFEETKKGNIIVKAKGKENKNIGLSAHVDTLGLMVTSINSNGTLNFLPVGGPIIPSLDSEYCKIYTRDNKVYTGTILSTSESVHVYQDAQTKPRTPENMVVRIDEKVRNKNDVLNLGINNGDFICYNPKVEIINDFVKSRFLDDKASAGILITLLKYLKENKIIPNSNLIFIFSTYEEVGHGTCNIPELDEFLAVDMGCVGKDLDGNEYAVSICAKDSFSPYDYDLTTKLINLAKDHGINYVIDVFPKYSSDVSAGLRGGNDFKGALIGPGVHASHGMERTHLEGLINTFNLLIEYIK